MGEDTTELNFREALGECVKAIEKFKDIYVEQTDEWENFIPKYQDRVIIESANKIKDTLKQMIDQSVRKDLSQFE